MVWHHPSLLHLFWWDRVNHQKLSTLTHPSSYRSIRFELLDLGKRLVLESCLMNCFLYSIQQEVHNSYDVSNLRRSGGLKSKCWSLGCVSVSYSWSRTSHAMMTCEIDLKRAVFPYLRRMAPYCYILSRHTFHLPLDCIWFLALTSGLLARSLFKYNNFDILFFSQLYTGMKSKLFDIKKINLCML